MSYHSCYSAGDMITILTRAIRSISRKFRQSLSDLPLQTEFDFSSPRQPPTLLRLDLSQKNMSPILDGISSCFAIGAPELRIELLGPGILLHDHALMVFDELKNRPAHIRLHVHSRTCLSDGALLLWLAGDTRSIRPDAWIQLSPIPPLPSQAGELGCYDCAVQIAEEEPAATDLRTIMDHIEEWLPVHEIAGLRLFHADMEDLGLLESTEGQNHLSSLFGDEATCTTVGDHPPANATTNKPANTALPVNDTLPDRTR